MKDRHIYLDHAATTPVHPEVLQEMLPFFTDKFGNPSSIYGYGRDAKRAIEESRNKVAKAIGADPSEIFFTGSGTEADNWAIKGVAFANKDTKNHIITTSIEHPAILHACQYLEDDGFEVTYLPVDKDGLVSVDRLRSEIRYNTALVSVAFANNEIGTIQPIAQIAELCKERGVYFHTDAVQAIGNIEIDVNEMNIDLLSMSGHKFYGPKGVGALYVKKGVKLASVMHGGAQESKRRAGTENVAAIVGMGKAIEIASLNIEESNRKLINLRDRTIKGIMERIPYVRLNGHGQQRLPGNVNIAIEFVEGESMLLMLDNKGIAASSGSACTSGSLDPSHVLLAIGLPHEIAHGSLRLTFGEDNTDDDVDVLLDTLPAIVEKLREMSPLYEEVERGITNV